MGGLLLCISGCATDRITFLNYASSELSAHPGSDPYSAPRVSDGLAINYANSVEIIMRCRFTGARITREVSSTAQVGLAAFGGIGAAFGYSATTLASLGLGSAAIPDLQQIFQARARAAIYKDAAQMIHRAVLEYYAFNPAPSSQVLTPNGVTLVQRVSAAIDLVDNVLADRLPTQTEMLQAVESMTPQGASVQRVGTTPKNNLTASTGISASVPTLREVTVVTASDREQLQETADKEAAVRDLKRAIKSAREQIPPDITTQPGFYHNALVSAGIPFSGQILDEDDYVNVTDSFTDSEKLERLHAYFVNFIPALEAPVTDGE